MKTTRNPNQADVARLAGVSQALVSYVLNANPNLSIPAQTRQRILSAIAELGYVPDRSARSLRTRKTHTIAVALPDITNPYHPAFARGAQDGAKRSGYDLIIYNTDGIYEGEQNAVEAALRNSVDGLIGAFQHLKVAELKRLTERGIAVVLTEWYPHELGQAQVTFVGIDNVQAGADAVGYLLDQGHRRIAHITGIAGSPPAAARQAGYRQALASRNIPVEDSLICPGDFSIAAGFAAMQGLLNLPEPPDALFASNDLTAIGAIDAAQQAGLRIPHDLAVVGFDDIPAATIIRPRLTTIRPFQRQIGERAAEVLIEQIQTSSSQQERRIEMPFELIVRDSG